MSSHGAAQELRKASRLLDARDKLLVCAGLGCPKLVQGDCTTWLEQLERDIPSIVVSATDSEGRDLTDVRVLIEGGEVAKRLDGKPIELDPGDYTVRVVRPDGASVERQIVAKTGEKNTPVRVVFGKRHEPSTSVDTGTTGAPDRTWAWVFGGISIVALGTFSYFALKGQSDYDELHRSCAPNCSKSDSDSVKQKFLIADISLGVGILAAGAATYFYLNAPGTTKSAIGISARPIAKGAFVDVELGL